MWVNRHILDSKEVKIVSISKINIIVISIISIFNNITNKIPENKWNNCLLISK